MLLTVLACIPIGAMIGVITSGTNKPVRRRGKRFIDIVSTIVTVIATHPAEDAMLMARG
jgi:hypothetical protein